MPKKEDPTKSWPAEARNLYTPLRALGTGGFGAVWLASNKQQQQQEDQSDPLQTNSNKYVAIKLVGHPSCHPINDFTKMS
jgi:serine/threonine protein kinase